MKLKEIVARLGCQLEGDGEIEIRRIAPIEDAGASDLTFFANPKYVAQLRGTRASAVILGEQADAAPPPGVALLRAANPYLAFARAAEVFAPPPSSPQGVHRLGLPRQRPQDRDERIRQAAVRIQLPVQVV